MLGLIETLIGMTNLKDYHFLFLKYVILNSDNTGEISFSGKDCLFDSNIETPDYALRKIGNELFKQPLLFKSHQNTLVLRSISFQTTDATELYRVVLSQPITQNKKILVQLFEKGVVDNLLKLSSVYAKLIYLKISESKTTFTESDLRDLFQEKATSKLRNIIERKLKPSLKEITHQLGYLVSYTNKRENKQALITITMDFNANARIGAGESNVQA